jgi:hypothetical protein
MLSANQARHCYVQINETSLVSLKRSLYQLAIDYATTRSRWPLMDQEQRNEIDTRRTMAHNAFIDSVNILSRNMVKQEEDNSWRAILGDDRKVIGDFACYVAFFLALEAR